jgi:hypothetical protein
VNAQTTTYKSGVWSSAWDDDGIEVLKKEDRWPYKAKLLYEKGIDPYQVWIKGFREVGISPWVSMRMNDVHYNNDISHWIHSKFWREHPKYWRVQGDPQKGYFDRAFDYEHKEVRDYHMALIKELLERYDVDGLELDWLREPFCFRAGREKVGLKLLTEFMAEVRQLANGWATKRGHHIQIAARVPVRPETAEGFGLDAITWCKKDLLDILVLSPRFPSTDYDIPIELWRKRLGQAADTVKIAACLEVRIQPCSDSAFKHFRLANYETMCGFTAAMLDRGADLIYYFNQFYRINDMYGCIGIKNFEEYKAAMNNCGRMETVIDKPRRNMVTRQDIFPPGVSGQDPLPKELKPRSSQRFSIYTGPKPETGKVIVRIGLDKRPDIEEVKITASVNSVACKPIQDNPAPEEFLSSRVLQFEVPLDAMQRGYNMIEVFHNGNASVQKIVWVEFYIVL